MRILLLFLFSITISFSQISNGDFKQGFDNWTTDIKWTLENEQAINLSGARSADPTKSLKQSIVGLQPDVTYNLKFDYTIASNPENTAKLGLGVGTGTINSNVLGNVLSAIIEGKNSVEESGTYEKQFTVTLEDINNGLVLSFYKNGAGKSGTVKVDNVVIEEFKEEEPEDPVDPEVPDDVIGTPDAGAPNIIVMMCDDVGPECFTPYGKGVFFDKKNPNKRAEYKTPNIQTMADNGMLFKYAFNNSVCTPSRVKIMTGRHNFRNYNKFKVMDANEVTFGHIARKAGYKTMIAGKWQLSNDKDPSVDFSKNTGFDHFVLHNFNGVSGNRYNNPKLWTNDERITTIPEGEYWAQVDNASTWKLNTTDGTQAGGKSRNYGPDITSDYIVDFIRKYKDDKFFVYYPCILPHSPYSRTPDKNKSVHPWVDMIHYIDKIVGKLNGALDELGLSDNTIFIFTADNGTNVGLNTEFHGGRFPGGKGSVFNNGSWAPFIVQWKGEIMGGQISDETVGLEDVLPTIVDAMGSSAKLPTVKRDGVSPTNIDGQSLISYFKGETATTRDFTFVDYRTIGGKNPNKLRYIRHKQYRYVDGRESASNSKDPNNMTGWYLVGDNKPFDERFILDPNNLPDQNMRFVIENYMQSTLDEGSVITKTRFDANYVHNPVTLAPLSENKSSLEKKIVSSNPISGNFIVENLEGTTASVMVSNLKGQILINRVYSLDRGTLDVDMNAFEDGMYIIRVETAEGVIAQKLMKID